MVRGCTRVMVTGGSPLKTEQGGAPLDGRFPEAGAILLDRGLCCTLHTTEDRQAGAAIGPGCWGAGPPPRYLGGRRLPCCIIDQIYPPLFQDELLAAESKQSVLRMGMAGDMASGAPLHSGALASGGQVAGA